MAVNQSGIAISIKAFLPTGKTLDEAFNALSLVKAAHESGDYTALLAAAQIDEIKTEQKTRRIENHGVTVADLVNKADPLVVDPDFDDLPMPAEQLGDETTTYALKAETYDSGLAVVEDGRPLPWADTPAQAEPEPEAKPKRTKKGE